MEFKSYITTEEGRLIPYMLPTESSGTFLISEAEIDFGSKPVESGEFTITDAAINSSHKIIVTSSGNTATGRVGNDYSWENFSFSAIAGTGNFTVNAICGNGSVVGKRKIYYTYS